MSTSMYLRNAKEIIIANRTLKSQGYPSTVNAIKTSDRFVCNIVAHWAGSDLGDQRILEDAIVTEIGLNRQERTT